MCHLRNTFKHTYLSSIDEIRIVLCNVIETIGLSRMKTKNLTTNLWPIVHLCGHWYYTTPLSVCLLFWKITESIIIRHHFHIVQRDGILRGYSGSLHIQVHDIKSTTRSSNLGFGGGYSGLKFLSPPWEVPILGGREGILVQKNPFLDFWHFSPLDQG